ncbi:MAG: TIGR01620 family protein [Rhodovulum sulfidophilum]|uniref:TIGR01620 family protein n=1 Tax=Rhodovulum sulfidophilum TaxID=35806 RepID=A0A2W5NBB9_RHOSU|nr:MAG: TIGR01620 family protein [Rhodovulum sulfidophilum]
MRPPEKRDAPFVLDTEALPPPVTLSPADAAPPPEDDTPSGEAMLRMARMASRSRRSSWAKWFWALFTSLVSLVVSIAAYDYVMNLLARNQTLGRIVMGLMIALALVVLVQIVREIWAFRKLGRIDGFRADAEASLRTADRAGALELSRRLERFYAGRPEMAWTRGELAKTRDDILDADAVLALTERSLFAPLDAEARTEIEAAARTVAAATAIIPLAMMDVLAAASANIRMIRRIAEIYGAHSGFFGSWRLLGTVATHLVATGAVAAGDDLVHTALGGSVLAKLSRRFGEGVVNGALTARVGIAAMEVCRPLPFAALPRPKVSNVIGRALSGLFQTGSAEKAD